MPMFAAAVAIALGAHAVAVVDDAEPPGPSARADDAATTNDAPMTDDEARAALATALEQAGRLDRAWEPLDRELPFGRFVDWSPLERRLSLSAFMRSIEPVTGDMERAACIGAFNGYQRTILRLTTDELWPVRSDAAGLRQALLDHEPDAVERYCSEIRPREEAIERRWRAAERSLASTMRPFLGDEADPAFEEWEWLWARAAAMDRDLPAACRMDLRQIVDSIGTLASDAEFAAECEPILRELRRQRTKALWTLAEVSMRTRCASLRQRQRQRDGPADLAREARIEYESAREQKGRCAWHQFELTDQALEKLAELAGPERGDALQRLFDAAVAPGIGGDAADLADLERSLRLVLGAEFDRDAELQRWLGETRSRTRALTRRMRNAALGWSFDMMATGSSTDWVKCCDAVLEAGRERMAVARATVAGIRNRFVGTPFEAAVAELCDARDAALAAPALVTPADRMGMTLDLASPDDATTQLMRQVEARREEAEAARRAREAASPPADSSTPSR